MVEQIGIVAVEKEGTLSQRVQCPEVVIKDLVVNLPEIQNWDRIVRVGRLLSCPSEAKHSVQMATHVKLRYETIQTQELWWRRLCVSSKCFGAV